MSLVDRGYLILSSGEEDSISLNDRREGEFHFLQSLLQPFVEGVWVSSNYVQKVHATTSRLLNKSAIRNVGVTSFTVYEGLHTYVGGVSASAEFQWRSSVTVYHY